MVKLSPLPIDKNNKPIQGVWQTVGDGRKTIASAGTPETLVAASTEAKRVDVQALYTNTGQIAIGTTTVDAASGSERGIILQPGGSYTFYLTDLVNIYVDASVSSEGVTFVYYV